MSIRLSPCGVEYLGALVAPFSHKGVACIPDLHSVPSKKVRVKTRGTFSTGTLGDGWLVTSPWCTANNAASGGYTLAAYAGANTVADPTAPPVNTGQLFQSKLPYTVAQFAATAGANGVRARTVGHGVRIRYIGPELARSGQIIALRQPDNQTLVGINPTGAKNFTTAKTFTNQRQWIYCNYRPVRPKEYKFSPDPCTATDLVAYKFPIGFLITGTTNTSGTPGPAPFEFEVIEYVEFIGTLDNITVSHTDITAVSDVRNSLPNKSATDEPAQYVDKSIKKIVAHQQGNQPIVHKVIPYVKGLIKLDPRGKALLDAHDNIKKFLDPTTHDDTL